MTVTEDTYPDSCYADLDRPAPLDLRFGDPDDTDNPLGFAAFLDADDRGDLLFAGERALDAFGFGAEFVPVALGGRLHSADELARVLRPVFRRDVALGLGHGASNLVGSVNVWVNSGEEQQKWLARLLCRNGRIAAAYTDMSTGNDVARTGFRAQVAANGVRLSGRKQIINNLARAEAVTVLARTSDEPGSRSHTMMLLDMATVPRDRLRFSGRYRTSGVRAMYLGGMEFDDCPLPSTALAGGIGEAMETILRAFQVTRAVLPGAMIGTLDQQLRTVLDFATTRVLYGRSATKLPHVRSMLTTAYLDLLIADCLTIAVCRALHLLPKHTSVYAAAVKYLVPLLGRDAVDCLGVVLGARSFIRQGRYGIFQKHLRDLPVASLVHAGGTVCQATMIPYLPRLARKGWLGDDPACNQAFTLNSQLPELNFSALGIGAGPADPLLAALTDVDPRVRSEPVLGEQLAQLVDELGELRIDTLALAPRDRTPLARPVSFALAERYALLLAAAACLGTWSNNTEHPHPFFRDIAWLIGALGRITTRLGRPPVPGVELSHTAVFAELCARHTERIGFDLIGRRLA